MKCRSYYWKHEWVFFSEHSVYTGYAGNNTAVEEEFSEQWTQRKWVGLVMMKYIVISPVNESIIVTTFVLPVVTMRFVIVFNKRTWWWWWWWWWPTDEPLSDSSVADDTAVCIARVTFSQCLINCAQVQVYSIMQVKRHRPIFLRHSQINNIFKNTTFPVVEM